MLFAYYLTIDYFNSIMHNALSIDGHHIPRYASVR